MSVRNIIIPPDHEKALFEYIIPKIESEESKEERQFMSSDPDVFLFSSFAKWDPILQKPKDWKLYCKGTSFLFNNFYCIDSSSAYLRWTPQKVDYKWGYTCPKKLFINLTWKMTCVK